MWVYVHVHVYSASVWVWVWVWVCMGIYMCMYVICVISSLPLISSWHFWSHKFNRDLSLFTWLQMSHIKLALPCCYSNTPFYTLKLTKSNTILINVINIHKQLPFRELIPDKRSSPKAALIFLLQCTGSLYEIKTKLPLSWNSRPALHHFSQPSTSGTKRKME